MKIILFALLVCVSAFSQQAPQGMPTSPAALPFLAAGACPASSCGSVSFAPQGAATLKAMVGRRISGVGLTDLVVCSPTGAPISGGAVYQTAIRNGISPVSPAMARTLFNRTVALNWRNLLLEGAADASIALPVLGQAKVISMSSKWVIALLDGHVVLDSIQGQIRAHVPDPSAALALLLDPGLPIAFAGPGSCHESSMVIRFDPKKSVVGVFAIQ